MPEDRIWDELTVRIHGLLATDAPSAAWAEIDAAIRSGDAPNVAVPGPTAGFREVGGRLYHTHKSLDFYVQLQKEQVRRLAVSIAETPPGEERNLRIKALGGVFYNLASFTWPGWDEPEISIADKHLREGREAARRTQEIRLDPNHSEVAFSYTFAMAHWVQGAHAMATEDWDAARTHFAEEIECERGTPDDVCGRGYRALVDLLQDAKAAPAFESVLAELEARSDEDAAFYRDQLLCARRVFTRR